jgi:thiamine pyrophosphokinase
VSIIKDPDQYSTDFTKCLKYLNGHAAEIITSPRHQKKRPSNKPQESFAPNTLFSQSTLEIVILGGLGGRVDQAFSQIHHLYMMTQTQRQLRESQEPNGKEKLGSGAGGNLYLISEESITFVLQEGKNIIYTPATNRPDTDTVASVDQDSLAKENQPPLKRKRDQETGAETEYFFEENIGIIPLSAPASITTQGFEWDVEDWHTEIGGQLSTSNHIRADKVEVSTSVPVLFTVELAQRLKRA